MLLCAFQSSTGASDPTGSGTPDFLQTKPANIGKKAVSFQPVYNSNLPIRWSICPSSRLLPPLDGRDAIREVRVGAEGDRLYREHDTPDGIEI